MQQRNVPWANGPTADARGTVIASAAIFAKAKVASRKTPQAAPGIATARAAISVSVEVVKWASGPMAAVHGIAIARAVMFAKAKNVLRKTPQVAPGTATVPPAISAPMVDVKWANGLMAAAPGTAIA